MKERLTNFEGDAEVSCAFCNKPQRDHFVNVGEIDGETCLHHWPCSEQIATLWVHDTSSPGVVVRLLRYLFASRTKSLPIADKSPHD